MAERLGDIDRKLFRNPHGFFGETLNAISPAKGECYLNSPQKRALDIVIGAPLALAAAPVVGVLAAIKKVEDGDGAFLVQGRLKNERELFPVVKIRSMVDGAHKQDSIKVSEGKLAHEDPRVTKFGAFMRRSHLDELPQVFQAVIGQMSLVGNRPILPQYADHLSKAWSRKRYRKWITDYGKGKKGVTGLYQVFGPQKRHDQSRFGHDMFYTRNASLGLDLYILWKTIGRVLWKS